MKKALLILVVALGAVAFSWVNSSCQYDAFSSRYMVLTCLKVGYDKHIQTISCQSSAQRGSPQYAGDLRLSTYLI